MATPVTLKVPLDVPFGLQAKVTVGALVACRFSPVNVAGVCAAAACAPTTHPAAVIAATSLARFIANPHRSPAPGP